MKSKVESPYVKGDKVKVAGERGGVFVVYRTELSPDGSILLYGGDSNPNGVRNFRSFPVDKVLPADKAKKKGGK